MTKRPFPPSGYAFWAALMPHPFEIVPKPLYGRNLRKLFPNQWRSQIRPGVFARTDRCYICNAGALYAHEIWAYDDKRLVQRLVSVEPICELCHLFKHMGRTDKLRQEGVISQLKFKRVVAHGLKINRLEGSFTLELYVAEHQALWKWRDRQTWKQNLGPYQHLVSSA